MQSFQLKQLWMIQTKDSLWVNYMRRRYMKSDPLLASLPYRSSAQWKRLYKLRLKFHNSCRWIVGGKIFKTKVIRFVTTLWKIVRYY